MEILLTKGARGNEHVLACKRKNASTTWKHVSPFFIMHDICHYAVETVIPFHDAFLGMIKKGADITEFELPKSSLFENARREKARTSSADSPRALGATRAMRGSSRIRMSAPGRTTAQLPTSTRRCRMCAGS